MRIAQVAPLFESVPPKYYGGTERVVSWLTEELVRMGHDVTLFASGDSVTTARLVPICRHSLRLDEHSIDHMAHHMLLLEKLFQEGHEFDIIHSHIDYLAFPLIRRHPELAVLTTMHGRMDIPDLQSLYAEYQDMPVVSISHSQRKPLPHINWISTVYHGLPRNLYQYQERSGDYLAFLGRISPEKRVDAAIEIATRVQIPLKIAAKVDKVDMDYFQQVIHPLLRNPLIEYLGEIGEAEKNEFLGNACALLFPIDWPEPFGLVMIEAMACGTPIIAQRNGSVPEVIENGVTGFIVADIDEAVQAVEKTPSLSRRHCRQIFEERFSSERMARDYLQTYEALLNIKAQSKQLAA
jgi:glycosyltransferase involved in cell wall biosynthesis